MRDGTKLGQIVFKLEWDFIRSVFNIFQKPKGKNVGLSPRQNVLKTDLTKSWIFPFWTQSDSDLPETNLCSILSRTQGLFGTRVSRVARFGLKVGQIGAKWDKSGDFFLDQIQYVLARRATIYRI